MSINVPILMSCCGYVEECPCLWENHTKVVKIMGRQVGNVFDNDSEGRKLFVLFLEFSISMKSFQN